MSTPDPKGGAQGLPPVGEVSLLAAQMPRNTETPQYPSAILGTTPGFALAGVRPPPGAPTLPELDVMSMQNAISQIANAMFASHTPEVSPPANGVPHHTDTSAMSEPPTAAMASTPGVSSSAVPGNGVHGSPDIPHPAQATSFDAPSAHAHPGVSSVPHHTDTSAFSHAPTAAMTPSTPSFAQNPPLPISGAPTPPNKHDFPNTPGQAAPFGAPIDFSSVSFEPPQADYHFPLKSHDVAARRPNGHDVTTSHPAYPTHQQPAHDPRFELDVFEMRPHHDPSVRSVGTRIFDPNVIKAEFPILHEPVRGKRLVWLDNAATTQKPRAVIDRLKYFYEHENSNIHRAAHTLAAKATDAYEGARESVRRFINAPSKNEIVFVRGTTEGINFLAQSYGRRHVREGDEIVITNLEHHANIVPWQMLCQEKGAKLKVAPVDNEGSIILEEYEKLLSPRTRIVSLTQVSNALGTITPAKEMIAMAHRHGAIAILDGAQSVSHMPVDVQDLDADFFVFSGHKVFGPTGIGAVFGKMDLLEHMPPWQGGGNMIEDVTFEKTKYQPPPMRFEAGTGNIADAVGLGAALDWVTRVGIHNIERYEHELLEYGHRALATVPGLTMVGCSPHKAGVLSFVLAGQNTPEVGGLLDQEGIAVRSGHHCAQPILRRMGYEHTVRASLAPYNTCEDIDALVRALHEIQSGRR